MNHLKGLTRYRISAESIQNIHIVGRKSEIIE